MAFNWAGLKDVAAQKPFTSIGKTLGSMVLAQDEKKKIEDAKQAYLDKLAGNPNVDLEATNAASKLEDEAKAKEAEAAQLEPYGKFQDLGVQKQALLDEAAKLREEANKYKGHLDPYSPSGLSKETEKEMFGLSYTERQKNAEEQAAANEAEAVKTAEIMKKYVSPAQIQGQVTDLRSAAKAAAEKAIVKKEEAKTLTAAETEKQDSVTSRLKALAQTLAEHPEAAKAGFGKELEDILKTQGTLEMGDEKLQDKRAKIELEDKANKAYMSVRNDSSKSDNEKFAAAYEFINATGKTPKLPPIDDLTDPRVRAIYPTAGIAASTAELAGTKFDYQQKEDAKKLSLEQQRVDIERERAAQAAKATTKFPAEQSNAAIFSTRMELAEVALKKLEGKGFDPGAIKNAIVQNDYFNIIKDPEQQQFAQAKRNFINAVLRKESGAAIAASEFDSANKQYFAQIGDGPEVLEQKRQNRLAAIAGMKVAAGGAYEPTRQGYLKSLESAKVVSPKTTTTTTSILPKKEKVYTRVNGKLVEVK